MFSCVTRYVYICSVKSKIKVMHYNLINEAMNARKSVKTPKVGMCGTMFCGSDRYAMVVTEVISKTKIRATMMSDKDYQAPKDLDEDGNEFLPESSMADYSRLNAMTLESEPRGKVYSFRKNHRWIEKGGSLWGTGSIHLGSAENYRDPSF